MLIAISVRKTTLQQGQHKTGEQPIFILVLQSKCSKKKNVALKLNEKNIVAWLIKIQIKP